VVILSCKGSPAQVQLKSLSHLHQVKHMIVGCQIRLQTIYINLNLDFCISPFSSPPQSIYYFFLLQFLTIYLQSFYYFAIVEDLILRFAWAYSYVLIKANYISEDLMTSINSLLEVFRYVINYFLLISMRCMFNMFISRSYWFYGHVEWPSCC
jgi:EXS family.